MSYITEQNQPSGWYPESTGETSGELPSVSAADNGKFLRVVNGAWAAATVPSAESNSFGGGS